MLQPAATPLPAALPATSAVPRNLLQSKRILQTTATNLWVGSQACASSSRAVVFFAKPARTLIARRAGAPLAPLGAAALCSLSLVTMFADEDPAPLPIVSAPSSSEAALDAAISGDAAAASGAADPFLWEFLVACSSAWYIVQL